MIPMDMMTNTVFTIQSKTQEELDYWREWLTQKSADDVRIRMKTPICPKCEKGRMQLGTQGFGSRISPEGSKLLYRRVTHECDECDYEEEDLEMGAE